MERLATVCILRRPQNAAPVHARVCIKGLGKKDCGHHLSADCDVKQILDIANHWVWSVGLASVTHGKNTFDAGRFWSANHIRVAVSGLEAGHLRKDFGAFNRCGARQHCHGRQVGVVLGRGCIRFWSKPMIILALQILAWASYSITQRS